MYFDGTMAPTCQLELHTPLPPLAAQSLASDVVH